MLESHLRPEVLYLWNPHDGAVPGLHTTVTSPELITEILFEL